MFKMFANDVTEWVIAESEEEANQIIAKHHGFDVSEMDEFSRVNTELSPNSYLTMDMDLDGRPVKKTVREWIEEYGKGYFGTTEY